MHFQLAVSWLVYLGVDRVKGLLMGHLGITMVGIWYPICKPYEGSKDKEGGDAKDIGRKKENLSVWGLPSPVTLLGAADPRTGLRQEEQTISLKVMVSPGFSALPGMCARCLFSARQAESPQTYFLLATRPHFSQSTSNTPWGWRHHVPHISHLPSSSTPPPQV